MNGTFFQVGEEVKSANDNNAELFVVDTIPHVPPWCTCGEDGDDYFCDCQFEPIQQRVTLRKKSGELITGNDGKAIIFYSSQFQKA